MSGGCGSAGQLLACDFDDVLCVKAKVAERHLARRRQPKRVHGNDGAMAADIAFPVQAGCGLDRDTCLHRVGQHAFAVGIVLASERADPLMARLCKLQGKVALFWHGEFGVARAVRWMGLPLVAGQHSALHPVSLSVLG